MYVNIRISYCNVKFINVGKPLYFNLEELQPEFFSMMIFPPLTSLLIIPKKTEQQLRYTVHVHCF